MVKTLNTVDGGVVTGYQEAFDLVVALCEADRYDPRTKVYPPKGGR